MRIIEHLEVDRTQRFIDLLGKESVPAGGSWKVSKNRWHTLARIASSIGVSDVMIELYRLDKRCRRALSMNRTPRVLLVDVAPIYDAEKNGTLL